MWQGQALSPGRQHRAGPGGWQGVWGAASLSRGQCRTRRLPRTQPRGKWPLCVARGIRRGGVSIPASRHLGQPEMRAQLRTPEAEWLPKPELWTVQPPADLWLLQQP